MYLMGKNVVLLIQFGLDHFFVIFKIVVFLHAVLRDYKTVNLEKGIIFFARVQGEYFVCLLGLCIDFLNASFPRVY